MRTWNYIHNVVRKTVQLSFSHIGEGKYFPTARRAKPATAQRYRYQKLKTQSSVFGFNCKTRTFCLATHSIACFASSPPTRCRVHRVLWNSEHVQAAGFSDHETVRKEPECLTKHPSPSFCHDEVRQISSILETLS